MGAREPGEPELAKAARTPKIPKSIIGWREWCAMPELALPGVLAKIDTGAKTSSLHAFDIRPGSRGEDWLEFSVHPVQRRGKPVIRCEARCIDVRKVTSSNGRSEERPVIETVLELGPQRFRTEITLSNRDEMGFRMLIGRQSLTRRFIVDPSLSYGCGDRDERELYPLKP